ATPNTPPGTARPNKNPQPFPNVPARHNLLVISDEIYDRLVYGIQHTQFATLKGARPRTIVLSGFSKSHAMTGWRIGYAAAPPELLDAMRKIHQYTIMSAPTTAQAAALEAVKSDDDVHAMLEEDDRRRKLMVKGFNELGLSCFEPRGAFYTFPNITAAGMDENEFAERLLQEEQVAVVPGTAFGASGAGHVRACYATAYEKIEE